MRCQHVNSVIDVFIWLSLGCLYVGRSQAVVYIDGHCGDAVRFHTSEFVQIRNWSSLPIGDSPCVMKLIGFSPYHHDNQNSRIHLTVLLVSISNTELLNCTEGRVDVVDSDDKTFLSGKRGICGEHYHHSFDSTRSSVHIRVTSKDKSLNGKLNILATAFNTETCDTKKEFCCNNGRCVDKTLECNGHDNCGDDSDETGGCLLSTLVIVLIAVGAAVVVVAMVVVIVMAFRRNWRSGWGKGPSPGIPSFSVNDDSEPLSKSSKPESYGAT